MKALIVHNVNSGQGDGMIFDFIRSYAEDGDTITLRPFGGKTPFKELVKDAQDYDFVIASGGDSTIAAVTYELRYTNIPILPFPSGTANLLAMNLFLPNEPHALSKVVDQANTLTFDLGEIQFGDEALGFTLMAGCGYDELIMRLAAENKKMLGPMAYFHAAFTNPNPLHSEFVLTIDGQSHETDGIGVVFANFSKIQFDLMVSDDNLPRDKKLDIVVLKSNNAVELLPTLFAKVVDRSGDLASKTGHLEVYRGSEITIEADPPMLMEFDGEATDITTPFTVRCLPAAARYIVSDEGYHFFTEEQDR